MMTIQDNLILDDPERGIVLPTVKYHAYAQITPDVAFSGAVVPIPNILTKYLKNNELKVFSIILDEMRKHTMCYASQTEMGEELGVTNIAISHAMHNLVKMGLVVMVSDKNVKRNNKKKVINFETLNKLNEMFADAKKGSIVKFREFVGEQNVNDLTHEQSEFYKIWCKKPENEIEAEEYN